MVSASVSTIKGGAMNEISVMKSLRLSEIAYENRLPCIALIQSVRLVDHDTHTTRTTRHTAMVLIAVIFVGWSRSAAARQSVSQRWCSFSRACEAGQGRPAHHQRRLWQQHGRYSLLHYRHDQRHDSNRFMQVERTTRECPIM
jgi:hypothetical protein